MHENALIIFIKNPEAGKVKTRLAATLGDEQALKIYQALLLHTRKISQQVAAERYLYYSRFIDRQDQWLEQHFHKKVQTGADLGQRMANAFRETLQHHRRAVIIGSDAATLTVQIIERAFEGLDRSDFTIGPAMDGGYYLLGMRKFTPRVFEDISWSTETVLEATLDRVRKQGASYTLLPRLSDIDNAEDWEKYGWKV